MRDTLVVLVADDATSRESCAGLLESAGFKVAAGGPGEVPDLLRRNAPALILLEGQQSLRLVESLPGHIPKVFIGPLEMGPGGNGPAYPRSLARVIYRPCRPMTLLNCIEDVLGDR